MKSSIIRKKFLDYFVNHHHHLVDSSSLLPDDKSLLFANSGMVQFKKVFLGEQQLGFTRATTCQKCVRAGGKHNDLDNVGFTTRHHTFFEMLGNFSFGDYDKQTAIRLAWDFLTNELGIEKSKLYITYHYSDNETRDIWYALTGFSDDKIISMGDGSNFWAMGDTGPCGPCTEIFYDRGDDVEGGKPGTPDEDGDRYVEIWNLVFMQYEARVGGERINLPKLSVDTGMGLERISSVMQGKISNYDTDLFTDIKDHLSGLLPKDHKISQFTRENVMNVISDHIRSATFLIADGVLPSNEKQGYVLRRIIRRALSFAYRYGVKLPFFSELVPIVVSSMEQAYPYLETKQAFIKDTILNEENKFLTIIEDHIDEVESLIKAAKASSARIDAAISFKLYDTYGFPVELLSDLASFSGVEVDIAGFDDLMEKQKQNAKSSSSFSSQSSVDIDKFGLAATEFVGYDELKVNAKILAIFDLDMTPLKEVEEGEDILVVLDKTPFYAEGGGQRSDTGAILLDGEVALLVEDVKKGSRVFIHRGTVSKPFAAGKNVIAQVDAEHRYSVSRAHTATHLLHQALIDVLGEGVEQKGSRVDAGHLRFDFSYAHKMSESQRIEVEEKVNSIIGQRLPVRKQETSLAEAMKMGAKALFEDKYQEKVRVLSVGDYSVELCGGTHIANSSEIEVFQIIKEEAIASGVRRIEAAVGGREILRRSYEYTRDIEQALKDKAEENKHLKKEIEMLRTKFFTWEVKNLLEQKAQEFHNVHIYCKEISVDDRKVLKDSYEVFKTFNKTATLWLIGNAGKDGSLTIGLGLSKDLSEKLKANDLVRQIGEKLGGKGGGKAEFAECHLPSSNLAEVKSILRGLI